MSVPSEFTTTQIEAARLFIINHLSRTRFRKGRVIGNPYITYGELVRHLGFTVESKFEGDWCGHLAAEAGDIELPKHNLMLSAVIVRADKMTPGHGFYAYAEVLGLFNSNGTIDPEELKELTFWNNQVINLVQYYGI